MWDVFATIGALDPSDQLCAARLGVSTAVSIIFSDTYHLLVSAWHTVQGRITFQGYLAFQIMFGPEQEPAAASIDAEVPRIEQKSRPLTLGAIF
jgi:hypothetical protein